VRPLMGFDGKVRGNSNDGKAHRSLPDMNGRSSAVVEEIARNPPDVLSGL
jgi:hypothetical protein